MCLRAIKTKHYSCSAYLSSVSWAITLTYTLNRLSSFQNLRRKGGKFDQRPKVLLRHRLYTDTGEVAASRRCRRSVAVSCAERSARDDTDEHTDNAHAFAQVLKSYLYSAQCAFNALRRCWLGGRRGIRPVKN